MHISRAGALVVLASLAACQQHTNWMEPTPADRARMIERETADTQAFLDEVDAGRDIDEPYIGPLTRLQATALYGDRTTEPLRMLIEADADIHARTPDGRTPLMLAALAGGRVGHGISHPRGFVEAIIEGGADVDARDDADRTALSWCAERGDDQRIGVLIDAGADVDSADDAGKTPLMWAAGAYWPNAKVLLDAGADPNRRDQNGWSALTWTARGGASKEALRNLIRAGAELESTDDDGWTPVMHAADTSHSYEPVAILLEAGASPEPAGWSDLVTLMLRRGQRRFDRALMNGADLEARDAWGRTALVWSAHLSWRRYSRTTRRYWYWNPTSLLIEAGADLKARDDHGDTALHVSVSRSLPALRTLIEAGVDLEIKDAAGRTPIIRATETRYGGSAIDLLLAGGADPDARDEAGRTPLMASADNPDGESMIGRLLRAGADPRLTDDQGRTALDYVQDNPATQEKERIIAMLKSAAKIKDMQSEQPRSPEDEQ